MEPACNTRVSEMEAETGGPLKLAGQIAHLVKFQDNGRRPCMKEEVEWLLE